MKTSLIDTYLQTSSEEAKKSEAPAFLEHLLERIRLHISKGWKILLITLTKKSSEEVTSFLIAQGFKAFYLHSEIVREGIDLPEVTLIGVLDADKEGFLRSTTSLVQIIGRAARNPNSEVILYADDFTESMIKALWETYRRRAIQEKFNKEHGITPKLASSNVKSLETVKTDLELEQSFWKIVKDNKTKKLKKATKAEKAIILKDLKIQLDEAIKAREFEKAAVIRDQIKEISWE